MDLVQNPHPHFYKASYEPEHKLVSYSSFSLGVITVLSAWKHCSTYCMLSTLFSGTQSTMTGTWKGSSVAMKEFTAFCRENSSLSVQPGKESGMLPLLKACSHRLNSCSWVNFRDRKSSSVLQGSKVRAEISDQTKFFLFMVYNWTWYLLLFLFSERIHTLCTV